MAGVEAVLGFTVSAATSQTSGFSPGVAALVHGPEGQRAFVKAVSSLVNPDSPTMHRDEARWTALLPEGHGSPRLLGSYDDGTWVALVLDAVEGRPPRAPWTAADLAAAVALLNRQAQVAAPAELPAIDQVLRQELNGFALLAADPPELTAWEARHLDALAELEAGWTEAAAGDRWLHNDSRGDNMLIRPDGSAVLVDWPWSAAGDPTFDALAFVPAAVRDGAMGPMSSVGAHVGEACEALFSRFAAARTAPPAGVTAMVAAFAGLMQHRRRQPQPPGMPSLRAFQASQGEVALAWLRVRTGWV